MSIATTSPAHPAIVTRRRVAGPATIAARPDDAPDYTMRRVGALVVVLCSLLIASVALTATVDAVRGLGGRPAAASETASVAPATYVAGAGDTLWSIAERFRGDVDLVRYVDALIAQNGGTTIDVGQAVRLP
jgi:hypothetical protein